MLNEIPILALRKNNSHILYFDADKIDRPNKIETAYIKVTPRGNHGRNHKMTISINEYLLEKDLALFEKYEQAVQRDYCGCSIFVDVTEEVKMIASGYAENNGFILEGATHLLDSRLVLNYYRNKIFPCGESIFFEGRVRLFSYMHSQKSPWFYSGISDTITFFVHNKGDHDVVVHLERGPDSTKIVKEMQEMRIHPGQTVDIVPYRFSKFIRIVASSEKRRIDCNVWHQAQLIPL